MDIKEKADFVLQKVTAAGATGDLMYHAGNSLSLRANEGDLEEHQVTSSSIMGVRVIKDQKVGTAFSEAMDPESLSTMVEQALSNAEFAAPEEHETILANGETLRTDDALMCPNDEYSINEKIELTLKLERDLISRDKIKAVPYNGVSGGLNEKCIYSTAGLDARARSKSLIVYAYTLAEDGDRNAMFGKMCFTRGQIIDEDALIDEIYEKCMYMLEGQPIKSGHYDVIFDTETQSSLFSVFSMMFSAKAAKEETNPWRNKLQNQVGSPDLTIYDNPTMIDGFNYRLFDDEGSVAKKVAIVENGVLQTLLHNSMTASYFGVANTANAARGPKSALEISIHQLEIPAGSGTKNVLEQGDYLVITDLDGLHSGGNVITGDFCFGASGYLCRNGERVQPVRQVTVAGNFYKMLLDQVSIIGDEQFWNRSKSALMPSIRFKDLTISGS